MIHGKKKKKNKHTYTGFINSHIKSINQVFQERADQTEIEPANAPRAIYQDDNISNRRCGADELIDYRMTKEKQRNTRFTLIS